MKQSNSGYRVTKRMSESNLDNQSFLDREVGSLRREDSVNHELISTRVQGVQTEQKAELVTRSGNSWLIFQIVDLLGNNKSISSGRNTGLQKALKVYKRVLFKELASTAIKLLNTYG